MNRLLVLAALCCLASGAVHAQGKAIVLPGGCGTANYTSGFQDGTQDTAGRGCGSVTGAVTTTPATTTVQGTLAVSNSSIALSTLTLAPNSAAWAMPPPNSGQITVKNNGDSTSNVRICWLGGACTNGATSNGKIIEPGASSTVKLAGSTAPTVICDVAASCNLSITE